MIRIPSENNFICPRSQSRTHGSNSIHYSNDAGITYFLSLWGAVFPVRKKRKRRALILLHPLIQQQGKCFAAGFIDFTEGNHQPLVNIQQQFFHGKNRRADAPHLFLYGFFWKWSFFSLFCKKIRSSFRLKPLTIFEKYVQRLTNMGADSHHNRNAPYGSACAIKCSCLLHEFCIKNFEHTIMRFHESVQQEGNFISRSAQGNRAPFIVFHISHCCRHTSANLDPKINLVSLCQVTRKFETHTPFPLWKHASNEQAAIIRSQITDHCAPRSFC